MMRKLGARPGELSDTSTFTLPDHAKLNLSPKQSADRIAEHFAQVSQEFEPLSLDRLPLRVQNLL